MCRRTFAASLLLVAFLVGGVAVPVWHDLEHAQHAPAEAACEATDAHLHPIATDAEPCPACLLLSSRGPLALSESPAAVLVDAPVTAPEGATLHRYSQSVSATASPRAPPRSA